MPLKDYLRKVMSEAYLRIVENTNPAQHKSKTDNKSEEENIGDPEPAKDSVKSILTYCTQADEFRESFNEDIEMLRAQINEALDEVKTSGCLYINELNLKIKEVSAMIKQVENVIKENKEFV